MNSRGARLYYLKETGEVLLILGDLLTTEKIQTVREEFESFYSLSEYDFDKVDVLEFECGKYLELSKDSTSVVVDVDTKAPIFCYEEIQVFQQEMTYEQELENKISILEAENRELREELTQIQTSIASLTSLMAVTLEEK